MALYSIHITSHGRPAFERQRRGGPDTIEYHGACFEVRAQRVERCDGDNPRKRSGAREPVMGDGGVHGSMPFGNQGISMDVLR